MQTRAKAERGFNLRSSSSILLLLLVLLPLVVAPTRATGTADSRRSTPFAKKAALRYCGYDPSGADDEWLMHKANEVRFKQFESPETWNSSLEIALEDIGDTAVINDDGSIVIPPNKFDLKGRAVIFVPDDGGYRIESSELRFNTSFGTRLTGFASRDGQTADADDGFVAVALAETPFPFFGQSYDEVFVGTNGYITMTRGDTTARISPSILANDLPRIAPLWADLIAGGKGKIFYNRLEDRHLFTWNKLPQPLFAGKCTFQLSLYDDGRIAFVYKNAKAHAALVGISPGGDSDSTLSPQPVVFSNPTAEVVRGPVFEVFTDQKRLDLPALTRAFYAGHPDSYDTIYIWTDFDYDNGLSIAHEFNIRNDTSGIGLSLFDRGLLYGSRRLASIITMGNSGQWPADPQEHMAGMLSAVAIVCHEQGHRWLSYIGEDRNPADSLLGRDQSHWSFFLDTRTRPDGTFSSLMEGNSWEGGNGVFTTIEAAVNYFSPLDQYLMGLRSADEVGDTFYLVTDRQLTAILQEKSPLSGFSVNSNRKNLSIQKIIEREGPRVPDAATAPKEVRVAFVLLVEAGDRPSDSTLKKMAEYRHALERYFAVATDRRGSLSASLQP
jgi:hypothetical protein